MRRTLIVTPWIPWKSTGAFSRARCRRMPSTAGADIAKIEDWRFPSSRMS